MPSTRRLFGFGHKALLHHRDMALVATREYQVEALFRRLWPMKGAPVFIRGSFSSSGRR